VRAGPQLTQWRILMKLNIEIEADNAAFDDYPRREITRILRELADKTERGIYYDGRDVPMYDPEGNKIGFCKIFLKKGLYHNG
jgi:hypothetical protein